MGFGSSISVGKKGGKAKPFDILSLLNKGYSGFLYEFTGEVDLNSAWRRLIAPKNLTNFGVGLEFVSFSLGDIIIENRSHSVSGEPVSSVEDVRLGVSERVVDANGTMEQSRTMIPTQRTAYVQNTEPCGDSQNTRLSISISPDILLLGRTAGSSNDYSYQVKGFWEKTGATGSMCTGSVTKIVKRIFIKSDVWSGTIDEPPKVTITQL